MDQSSGIRAKTRRRRGEASRRAAGRGRALSPVVFAVLLAGALDAFAAGGHDAPAVAPVTTTPAAPVPLQPRPLPPDVQPPIAGPIAAPSPKPRIRWVADPVTGLALGGYDPVGYFLEGRPVKGDRRWQYDWSGTTWLFHDEGDLAAFRDAPEVYAPAFGGRCALAVASGRPAEGSPLLHVIWRGRLLLFADPTSRYAFMLEPDRLLNEALSRWPAIAEDLP